MRIADISSYQSDIDIVKLYNEGSIEGFIFRLGYGDNLEYQDDLMFDLFRGLAVNNNIPWGVYLFSYALTVDDVKSEIDHVYRVLSNDVPPLGIWYDIEDSMYKETRGFKDIDNPELISEFANTFVKAMYDRYPATESGLYCDLYHYRSNPLIHDLDHLWIACYTNDADPINPPIVADNLDMWQYTSNGNIDGYGGRLDLNYIYRDWIVNAIDHCKEINNEKPKPNEEDINDTYMTKEIIFEGGPTIMKNEMTREQLKYEVNRHALTLLGREIGDADTYVDYLENEVIDWYEFDKRIQESEEGVKRWIKLTLFIDILNRIPDETEVNWWYAQYMNHYEMNKALMVSRFREDYESFKCEYINKQIV